ncbi:phosphatase PAP2 family protein [Pinisolibacter sp.]|uniref:phosphatase PAP2 family protein n=1 Tax=Pinisolibacter sp. TaxID=2172024 RepID=UPI002FDF0A29
MTDVSRAEEIVATLRARLGRAVAATGARPGASVAVATAAVSALALAFPGLDIAVASLFHHGADGFPADRNGFLLDVRHAGMGVTRIVVVSLVVAFLGKLFVPMLMRAVSSRKLLFLATSMALGPGIVVNSILKEFWGRPRPRQIGEFGGSMEFFPAWVPGGACETNCSFPSGEASSAMWLIALVFVVPERWRRGATIAVLAWALTISVNRMAFGAHFLSDVVIGWGLTATIVFACRWALIDKVGPMTEGRIDDGLEWVGERLLGLARRPAAWFRAR